MREKSMKANILYAPMSFLHQPFCTTSHLAPGVSQVYSLAHMNSPPKQQQFRDFVQQAWKRSDTGRITGAVAQPFSTTAKTSITPAS
jgi:hypothetical protein